MTLFRLSLSLRSQYCREIAVEESVAT